jgi:hypothetical protein
MARFLFPLLLVAIGVFGLLNHAMLDEQWAEMYPDDPAREAALAHCAQEDGMFNRFSEAGREACYQKYLQVELPSAEPGIAVGVPGEPAHAVPHPPTLHTNSNQR